ncbi:MAG: hypothetical protein V7K40_10350 [Nostoc sp.]|uniref:hypothetical protein n=1 Tax=Nostoc sp. TaxID=1180 RepID=UPI002FF9A32F
MRVAISVARSQRSDFSPHPPYLHLHSCYPNRIDSSLPEFERRSLLHEMRSPHNGYIFLVLAA